MKDLVFAFLLSFIAVVSLIICSAIAHAEPTIVYENKCIDESTWDCLNKTQACKRAETRAQVNRACRGRKCPTIYSIDPKRSRGDYLFGAWFMNRKLYFACMPGCPNARRSLEKLLRR